MTGLANRSLFFRSLESALDAAAGAAPGAEATTAVVLIDLDDFKPINDRYGHAAGDAVLRAIGERMLDITRERDTAARLGGDEFGIVLSQVAVSAIPGIADRLLSAITQHCEVDGVTVRVGCTAGVSVDHGSVRTPEELVRAADAALYRAKAAGKGSFAMENEPARTVEV